VIAVTSSWPPSISSSPQASRKRSHTQRHRRRRAASGASGSPLAAGRQAKSEIGIIERVSRRISGTCASSPLASRRSQTVMIDTGTKPSPGPHPEADLTPMRPMARQLSGWPPPALGSTLRPA
jgi:hypothetical protein